MTVAGTVQGCVPVSDAMLRDPKPEDWLMLRRDYAATSYSPLTQITADNVSQLQPAWVWPMRKGGTNQPAPLVYGGTMYLANTGVIVQALDARNGQSPVRGIGGLWSKRRRESSRSEVAASAGTVPIREHAYRASLPMARVDGRSDRQHGV